MSQQINHPTISESEIIRPTRVEVDLTAIKANYKKVKTNVGNCKIMPILKANAYGHGLLRIAQLFEELNADYLGVAVVEEGILLREKGINIPILVLGGVWGNFPEYGWSSSRVGSCWYKLDDFGDQRFWFCDSVISGLLVRCLPVSGMGLSSWFCSGLILVTN